MISAEVLLLPKKKQKTFPPHTFVTEKSKNKPSRDLPKPSDINAIASQYNIMFDI